MAIAAIATLLLSFSGAWSEDGPKLIVKPEAFSTLVNPSCSHCIDEAKRRAMDLRADDPVLCWTRGYSSGGVIPIRFFLNPYRVISDSYGVFVYDPEAGYARGFAPSYEFTFHGWRNGIMVMRHNDGTLYSCLSGLAFDGPRKGDRLTPIPTLTSTWGVWTERYPNAVAYRMFEKYQPVELQKEENLDSIKSRGKADPRLKADALVLGVRMGNRAKAYPIGSWTGIRTDKIDGESIVIMRDDRSQAASAFRPIAHQPRKFKAPNPNKVGVSPPDAGTPIPAGAKVMAPRSVSLVSSQTGFVDEETHSKWDVAGRCVKGELNGWTLEGLDAVVCKWFAWSAEHLDTTVYKPGSQPDASAKVKEIAGTAEFLRLLPKPFATVKAVDPKARTVSLLLDSEKVTKVWPVEMDAEIKVNGWWGRLEQLSAEKRVWVWLKLDRKKHPMSVVMIADELTEEDMHRAHSKEGAKSLRFAPEEIAAKRAEQQAWLQTRWQAEGLPGTLTFHHVFSGEIELTLDHEAMQWGRSLVSGDTVHLVVDPTIKGVVKSVAAWKERTVVRLVVGELESSELRIGQRLGLRMKPPTPASLGRYPPDIGRRTTKSDRVEWFLASVYCTCGVSKDVCTGHFYTLASCNPNGCGLPTSTRAEIAAMVDQGKTDVEIWDILLQKRGSQMIKPHLLP